jgi:hypothetical protein
MIIFGSCVLVIGFTMVLIINNIDTDSIIKTIITIAGGLLIACGSIITFGVAIEKDTYINSLKGNNPYKMEIRYEFKDFIYTPKDTIYINTKENR